MPTPEEIEWVLRREERFRAKGEAEGVLGALVLSRVQWRVAHYEQEPFPRDTRVWAVLPEPPMGDSERWSSSQGRAYYPYVRTLGGVSLFDFRGFESDRYSEMYPISTWREFVPYRSAWKEAVWIEIDTKAIGRGFISGPALLERWKADKVANRIMPEIEAAHLGRIPCTVFKSVFSVREGVAALMGDKSASKELEAYITASESPGPRFSQPVLYMPGFDPGRLPAGLQRERLV